MTLRSYRDAIFGLPPTARTFVETWSHVQPDGTHVVSARLHDGRVIRCIGPQGPDARYPGAPPIRTGSCEHGSGARDGLREPAHKETYTSLWLSACFEQMRAERNGCGWEQAAAAWCAIGQYAQTLGNAQDARVFRGLAEEASVKAIVEEEMSRA